MAMTITQRRPRTFHTRRQGKAAHIFLLPWLVGLGLVTAAPMLASLYLSFTNYNILSSPKFIGLGNFERLAGDERFWQSVKVTVTYVLVSVPLQLAFALFLALILDKGLRGLSFYRSAFYLPSLLGTSVAIAVLWREIFGHDGLDQSGARAGRNRGIQLAAEPQHRTRHPGRAERMDLRLTDGDLPGRAPADPGGALRVGPGRRSADAAAIRAHHVAAAHPDHLLQPDPADDRGLPVLHPGSCDQRRHWRPGRLDPVLHACTSTSRPS